jgi:hypothetical protein
MYGRTRAAGLLPYGSGSRSEASQLPSTCNSDTKVALRSGFPSLADLHPVQRMTHWHAAPTLPPSSCPHAGMFASSGEAKGSRSSPVPG